MRYRATALLAALALSIASGCGPTVRIDTPDGFATLDDQTEYVYRATSSEGVVVAVRREENQPHGTLTFWVGAIDRQLRRTGFQVAQKPAPVTNAAGMTGTLLRYDRDGGGRPDRYWIAVFVSGDHVWTVEAGGVASMFDARVTAAVERAIASMSPG